MSMRTGHPHWALLALLTVTLTLRSAQSNTIHVSTGGSHTPPFDSWTTASTNIQIALDYAADGDLVLLQEAYFYPKDTIHVTNALTMRSGGWRTSIQGPYYSGVYISGIRVDHADAVLDSLEITTFGNRAVNGGGIVLNAAATVTNCSVTSCYALNGGGVYISSSGAGALLRGCRFNYNQASDSGGGLYATGSNFVERCEFSGNGASTNGAGIWLGSHSVARSCHVDNNNIYSTPSAGGGIYCRGGVQIENCTVVRNHAAQHAGGIHAQTADVVLLRNSILWDNTGASNANYYAANGLFAHCCATPLPPGDGNIDVDPELPQFSGKLALGSPCVNTGTNASWMATAAGMDSGVPRIVGQIVDIGAYEVAYDCDFTYTPSEGFVPLSVVFTAEVYGGNNTNTHYAWDFDNDYVTDLEGYGLYMVTNVYGQMGTYTVGLQTRSPDNEYGNESKYNCIKVGAQYMHVATNGFHVAPFTNWVTAATNIKDAVELAVNGSTILIGNGDYRLMQELVLPKAVTLQGVNGAGATRITAQGNHRCIRAQEANTHLEGLTLTGGRNTSSPGGGGAWFTHGGSMTSCIVTGNQATAGNGGGVGSEDSSPLTLTDCRIVGNAAGGRGGGIYTTGPLYATNCIIRGNSAGYGGGVYADGGGGIAGCTIVNNRATLSYGRGGGLYQDGGPFVMTDCLVATNSAGSRGGGILVQQPSAMVARSTISDNTAQFGSGVCLYSGARLSHCRIFGNSATNGTGGGVYCEGSIVRNCLIQNNDSTGDGGGLLAASLAEIDSCTFTGNRSSSRGGGAWSISQASFENCIFSGNEALVRPEVGETSASQLTYSHCNTPADLLGGEGNVVGDPMFRDPAGGDVSIRYGSSALDAGTNKTWMGSGRDLGGNGRIAGGVVDIGAMEFDGPALGVRIVGGPHGGYAPLQVVFTAQVYRAEASVITYRWDFNNDGLFDQEGSGLSVATNTFATPGLYNLHVRVEDTHGQADWAIYPDIVHAWDSRTTHYVASAGTAVPPYTNWTTAANTVADALAFAADGDVVMLAAETHTPDQAVLLTNAVALMGPNGDPASTVVDAGGTHRCVTLAHPQAAIQYLTLTGGFAYRYGGGVYAPHGGTIANCFIRSNACHYSSTTELYGGAGVYLVGGRLENSLLTGNSSTYHQHGGGALLRGGATAWNCTFTTNRVGGRGGGLALFGSTADNCTFRDNEANYGGAVAVHDAGLLVDSLVVSNRAAVFGGGVHVRSGATAERCTVVSNSAPQGGGAYGDGRLRSCLIAHNSAEIQGGAVFIGDGVIESCTIVNNRCTPGTAIDPMSSSDTPVVINSVIYYNEGTNQHGFADATDVVMTHVCTVPIPTWTPANMVITNDPQFADAPGGNYRIGSGSPCFNSGLNEPWMVGALDMDGNARIGYGTVDIGAYESSAPAIVCDFSGTPREGRLPVDITFQAAFAGVGQTGAVYFAWDFDNDGTWDDMGMGRHTVMHTYTNTLYHSVSLYVSNAVGLTDTETKIDYIRALPLAELFYVATNGTHVAPFTNWTTAATTLQAAVSAAGNFNTVVVSNGFYALPGTLVVSNELEISSTNGADVTVVDGGGAFRCLTIAHSNAVIRGLTIQNGEAGSESGGGVLMLAGGRLESCTVTGNSAMFGAGVDATNGSAIADCLIATNRTAIPGSAGGGLRVGKGTVVTSCRIIGNRATYGGGVSCGSWGLLRNCAISGNEGSHGGGVHLHGRGTLESCTVSGNSATFHGGVYSSAIREGGDPVYGTLRNTIVTGNSDSDPGIADDVGGNYDDSLFDKTCVEKLSMVGLTGSGIVFGNANLADPVNLDLHLMPGSVCIDAGMSQPWMVAAFDLDGNPRIRGGAVDLGALEFDSVPLDCWFTRSGVRALTPYSVHFAAVASGADLAGMLYYWDTDGDGDWDHQGATLDNLTVVYDVAGAYNTRLMVSNSAGESAFWQYATPIRVGPRVVYVATNSAPSYPYATWATATTNIHDAIDMADDGTQIWVSNGVYMLQHELIVDRAITLRTVNGYSDTTIDANGDYHDFRCLRMTHRDALVEGLTIIGGDADEKGGGVYITHGTLRDCRIYLCQAPQGGGLFMEGVYATVERCLIERNLAYYYGVVPGGRGGGVFTHDGVLDRCTVRNNDSRHGSFGAEAGGIAMAGGNPIVRNCLVVSNQCDTAGGGVYINKGELTGCTIVENLQRNWHIPQGHELYWHQHELGQVRNCIIRHTTSGHTNNTQTVFFGYGTPVFTNCCADTNLPGTGNLHADPLFTLGSNHWYRLQPGSPCIDAGTQPTDLTRDYDGFLRPVDGDSNATAVVDIGASEYVPADLDYDSDGATDIIEVDALGSDPDNPDSDGDGYTDGEEWIAGTGATDSGDLFEVNAPELPATAPGTIVFSWYSALGRLYTVLYTPDLMMPWEDLAGYVNLPGSGGLMSLTNDTGAADQLYYRVYITMP